MAKNLTSWNCSRKSDTHLKSCTRKDHCE